MLKAILRKVVGKDHWQFLDWYRSRFGFLAAVRAYVRLFRDRGVGRAPNRLAGGDVFLRPGTADQDVYSEIFVDGEYDIDLGEPEFIVDAGAHIGLSSAYFASKYPNATVVAIEPEPDNFDLLLRNARPHGNIKPIRAGLWSRKARLRIQDSDVATWSFRVSEDPSGRGIPAVGVRDVMSDFGVPRVDVLKIDIEGSEVEVLSDCHAWIDAVKVLIIELHDRFRPGCGEALAGALGGHDYDESRSGESIVITNLRRKSA